jgi:hypothetical protein
MYLHLMKRLLQRKDNSLNLPDGFSQGSLVHRYCMNVDELQHGCGHVILAVISLVLNIYIVDMNIYTHHLTSINLPFHK